MQAEDDDDLNGVKGQQRSNIVNYAVDAVHAIVSCWTSAEADVLCTIASFFLQGGLMSMGKDINFLRTVIKELSLPCLREHFIVTSI